MFSVTVDNITIEFEIYRNNLQGFRVVTGQDPDDIHIALFEAMLALAFEQYNAKMREA